MKKYIKVYLGPNRSNEDITWAYPEAYRYGARTGGYLAVNNNWSVDRLRGTFSKRLEFEP